MWVWAHETVGTGPVAPRVFPGSAIFEAEAEEAANSAQQVTRARKRLIPPFVSSVGPHGFRLLGRGRQARAEQPGARAHPARSRGAARPRRLSSRLPERLARARDPREHGRRG